MRKILSDPAHYSADQRRSRKDLEGKWEKDAKRIKRAQRIQRRLQREKLLFGEKSKPVRVLKKEEFIPLVAPNQFSFVENHEEVLEYMAKAKELLGRGIQVNFDLSQIDSLTPDAIALLIANVRNRGFYRGVGIRGRDPHRQELRQMFEESGFYDHVVSKVPRKRDPKNLLLHRVTNYRTEPSIAKKVCQTAAKHTFGIEQQYPPLYDILVECMTNTNNHANPQQKGVHDWWLFHYCPNNSKVSFFAFIDLGVGIFKSFPARSYVNRFASFLAGKRNVDLVDDLLQGKITSRTGLGIRGKGFPTIYEHTKEPLVRNFVLITNDVYANISSGAYKQMKNEFEGTFLYWEIHPV